MLKQFLKQNSTSKINPELHFKQCLHLKGPRLKRPNPSGRLALGMALMILTAAGLLVPATGALAQVGIVDVTSESMIWHDTDQTTTRIINPKIHYGNSAAVPLQIRKCSVFGLVNPPEALSQLFDKVEDSTEPTPFRMLDDLSLWQCTAGPCDTQKVKVYKELFCAKQKHILLRPRLSYLNVTRPDSKIDPDGQLNYLTDLQVQIGNLNFHLAKTEDELGIQMQNVCALFGFQSMSFTQEIIIKVRSKFRPDVQPKPEPSAPIEFLSFSPTVHQRSVVMGKHGEFARLLTAASGSHRVVTGVYCGARLPQK